MKKLKDIIIYADPKFYSSFPSAVCRPDGEILVAFRRAPSQKYFHASHRDRHIHPNSQLVMVRSRDGGATWSPAPEIISAHPMGGAQDPCLVQLPDGDLLCSSYLWALVPDEFAAAAKRKPLLIMAATCGGNYAFCGGYLLRSADGGRHWAEMTIPPPLPFVKFRDLWGKPLPAYNRGAMLSGSDGVLYWAVAGSSLDAQGVQTRFSVHLLASPDRGNTWEYRCPIAEDEKISFDETSLLETAAGDIVAFIRTEDFDGHAVLARSKNRGRSFEPWLDLGFRGYPLQAVRLDDQRVLLVYGYRFQPFGVRARILEAECRDSEQAPEIILRDDGADDDLGYPWAVSLGNGQVLVLYYFHTQKSGSTHFIGGTLMSL